MLKGKPLSEEHKAKLRKAHLGRKRPLWMRKRMSEAAKTRTITPLFRKARSDNAKINPNYGMKGKKHSEESKKKMSLSRIGQRVGEKSSSWKGDDIGYSQKHKSVRNAHGNSSKCENKEGRVLDFECSKKSVKYEWALKKGHNYTRNKEDYFQLCISCHRIYDDIGNKAWKKRREK